MAKVPNDIETLSENFNRLNGSHERYRQTTDKRQTDGRPHIANVNASSRSQILSCRTEQKQSWAVW